MWKSTIILSLCALICLVRAEDVRLVDLDPPEAQQLIDSKDTSLKYAPKIESNVPAVRYIGNEPQNVQEDIYLANQYHGQDGLGGYLYGYSVPDIAKTERKKAGGDLRGAYNYISGDGQEIKVEYWDDGNGFHQIDNVPKILPKQIDDSPDVKAAKDEHARIWAEEAERNSKPIQNPYPNAQPGAYAGLGAGVGAGVPNPKPQGQPQGHAQGQAQFGGQGQQHQQQRTQSGFNQPGHGQGQNYGGNQAQGQGQGQNYGGNQGRPQQDAPHTPQQPQGGSQQQGQGYQGQQGHQGQQNYGNQGRPQGQGQGQGQGQSFGNQGQQNQYGGQQQQHHQTQGQTQGYGQQQGQQRLQQGYGNQQQGQQGQQPQHNQGQAQGQNYNKPQGSHDYSGQQSQNQNKYAQNPSLQQDGEDDGAYKQDDSEGQWQDDTNEPTGPPKGFFYNVDYPVGIIVSKQGGAQQGASLGDTYKQNKANFDQQLQGGAAVHGAGSYPSYQVHS